MSPVTSWNDLMKTANEGAKEFAPLEAGTYNFVIKDPAKIGQTGKGYPKFSINPSVETGPRANARMFHDFNVVESAFALKRFFFDDLEKLGLGPEFFEKNPSPEAIASALQGRRFMAEVFEEEGSDGVKRMKMRNFASATGAAPQAVAAGGVPSGLPSAGVPAPRVAQPQAPSAPAMPSPAPQAAQPQAPAAPVVANAAAPSDSPWATATQAAPAAPQAAQIPLPNPFNS